MPDHSNSHHPESHEKPPENPENTVEFPTLSPYTFREKFATPDLDVEIEGRTTQDGARVGLELFRFLARPRNADDAQQPSDDEAEERPD